MYRKQRKRLVIWIVLIIISTIVSCGGKKKNKDINPAEIRITSNEIGASCLTDECGVDIYPPNCGSITRYDIEYNRYKQPISFKEDACGYTIHVSCVQYSGSAPILCTFSIEPGGNFYAIADFDGLGNATWTVYKGIIDCPAENG